MQHQLRAASDFGTDTTPTKKAVDKFIIWIAAEIDMNFAKIGFYVPYQEITGEDWSDAQTGVLRMMNSFGVAGLIVGPVSKPAPSMGRDSGTADNAYTAAYKAFLQSIDTGAAGFRMNYRVGSKAEQLCRTPRGPTTDYLEGYLDPTLFQTISEYTEVIETVRYNYGIDISTPAWDHLKTRRDSLLA